MCSWQAKADTNQQVGLSSEEKRSSSGHWNVTNQSQSSNLEVLTEKAHKFQVFYYNKNDSK